RSDASSQRSRKRLPIRHPFAPDGSFRGDRSRGDHSPQFLFTHRPGLLSIYSVVVSHAAFSLVCGEIANVEKSLKFFSRISYTVQNTLRLYWAPTLAPNRASILAPAPTRVLSGSTDRPAVSSQPPPELVLLLHDATAAPIA